MKLIIEIADLAPRDHRKVAAGALTAKR